METDHIEQAADSHNHSIENAIPVCFECHAEIHAYNPRHPRGRKFTPEELRMHKEQWLKICETRPEILVEASRNVDIGPIQGMLDELQYNIDISREVTGANLGFVFREQQLDRAIREGVLSILEDSLRVALSMAYGAISQANESIRGYNSQNARDISIAAGMIAPRTMTTIRQTIPLIEAARNQLLGFVRSDWTDS